MANLEAYAVWENRGLEDACKQTRVGELSGKDEVRAVGRVLRGVHREMAGKYWWRKLC